MIADSTTCQDEDCADITSEEETNTPPPYRHLNLNQFLPNNPIGISDEDLVSRPIKEINKTFKTTGLPTSDQTKMKKKRRTLKNRGYAKTTRKRKEAEIKDLERVEQELKKELLELKRERNEKERSNEELRKSNMMRLNWALNSNIQIPEDILASIRKIGEDELC